MRSNKVYCFRAYYNKGVSHHHLVWQILKVKQRQAKTLQWKKGGLQVRPDWRLLA